MTLGRVLMDTAVFVYAVGSEHSYRHPCRRLVHALGEGAFDAEASVELVQEFLHQRVRRTGDRAASVHTSRQVASLCVLHDVTWADLRLALTLFETSDALHARDALHAATALNRDIGAIVSPDKAFDAVHGLERLEPAEAAARL